MTRACGTDIDDEALRLSAGGASVPHSVGRQSQRVR